MIRYLIVICWAISLGVMTTPNVAYSANMTKQETTKSCCTKNKKETKTKKKSSCCCQKDKKDDSKDCCGGKCNGKDCHCPSNNIATALLSVHLINKKDLSQNFIAKKFLLFNITKLQFGHTVIWIPPKVV